MVSPIVLYGFLDDSYQTIASNTKTKPLKLKVKRVPPVEKLPRQERRVDIWRAIIGSFVRRSDIYNHGCALDIHNFLAFGFSQLVSICISHGKEWV